MNFMPLTLKLQSTLLSPRDSLSVIILIACVRNFVTVFVTKAVVTSTIRRRYEHSLQHSNRNQKN